MLGQPPSAVRGRSPVRPVLCSSVSYVLKILIYDDTATLRNGSPTARITFSNPAKSSD
jgi:hypothetical protein